MNIRGSWGKKLCLQSYDHEGDAQIQERRVALDFSNEDDGHEERYAKMRGPYVKH